MAATLNLHKATSNYIGKIDINKYVIQDTEGPINTGNITTIIILDVSGSMSSYLTKIVNTHLPNALSAQGYKDSDPITLITFSSQSNTSIMTIKQLRETNMKANGGTYMEPAINNLRNVLKTSINDSFRILTISDGELSDQQLTLQAATNIASSIKGKYKINSSAIRLFTSSSQPDTRGLASILQLSSEDNAQLVDFACNNESEKELPSLFVDALTDRLGNNINIISEVPIFKQNPWDAPKTVLSLTEGTNIFWLSEEPHNIKIELSNSKTTDVNILTKENVTFDNLGTLLRPKIDFYVKKLKLLKVIDMGESKKEIDQIIKYFKELEENFAKEIGNVDIVADRGLKTRAMFFKNQIQRQAKSIIQELLVIANQDKVSQLNSAQQAEYLRNTTTSSNAINLAKRAMKQGLDFDVKAVQEVKKMKEHFDEIEDIDDSDHTTSFYSQCTTLMGITELCELDDDTIDNLSAIDILKMLNLVGVPCTAAVGDYPDPKTYHLTNIMLGSYVSMSDIIMAREQHGVINDPYTKKPIINTVPFYDDDRIQQFLIKYAPNLLEYTASLGMRNMILNVPHSYSYTIVGGLWWMVRELQDNKTEANANLFIKFVNTYNTAVGNTFSYVPKLIKPLSDEDKAKNLSMFIGNNGITNMIGPLIEIQRDTEKLKLVPDVLRAIYVFEYYQVLKKYFKTDSDGHIKRKQMLDNLLGIDFNKYASPLPELFSNQDVPKHHNECHVNNELFNDIDSKIFWVDYIAHMPKMFGYALKNDLKSLLELNTTKGTHESEFGLNYSLDKMKLFAIFQGLMYDNLASRFDETTSKMKIEDCANKERMDELLSDYIQQQYHSHYQSELSKQNKNEIEILTKQLIDEMVNTSSIDTFNNLLKNGITFGNTSVAISDVYKFGFDDLRNKLFDPNLFCGDCRGEKMRVLLLGCDRNKNVIFNKGNTVKMGINHCKDIFTKVGCLDTWNEMYEEYISRNIHIYRNGNNRHGHSNGKASFFAYGYMNLRSYFNAISKEEQDAYCKEHPNCCGIWDGKPVKWS